MLLCLNDNQHHVNWAGTTPKIAFVCNYLYVEKDAIKQSKLQPALITCQPASLGWMHIFFSHENNKDCDYEVLYLLFP